MKKEKGITLIALVITIIVLLILAGIGLNALMGDEGIITKAQLARNADKYGKVNDAYELYKSNYEINSNVEEKNTQTFDQFIEELENNGTITSDDVTQIETEGKLTIGEYEIIFDITLGEVYTDNMIGQKITYLANGQSNWIVFGRDEKGNILITTELPIDDAYELECSGPNWLTYENDLHRACSSYGTTVQGVNVQGRSITMEDINYIAEFTEPTFTEYTFGLIQDFENAKVSYYYPNLSEAYGWREPTKENEKKFIANWYSYYATDGSEGYEYGYWGEDTDQEEIDATDLINEERCNLIWGGNTEDTCYNEYLVATRSMFVHTDFMCLRVAGVGNCGVDSNYYYVGLSNRWGHMDDGDTIISGIRPVVVLPATLAVEKNAEGLYDLSE